MKISPTTTLKYFKFWPPFLASGISIKEFNLDEGHITSQMELSWWNSNAFGTMYGGSLYSMCDPFYIFILAHHFGKEFYIWDIESNIKFLKATKESVYARFEITTAEINALKTQADSGKKITPKFETNIYSDSGEIIASVEKTLYIKKKKSKN